MKKIIDFIFSMRMMALGLLTFFIAIGWATILESKYDIQTAKILIYNATWFELLLTFLGLNLIANIVRHQMFRREKIASLMFHLAFIVILIGGGVTRFFSFEGMMLIREGESSSVVYSADPHVKIYINDGKMQYKYDHTHFMSMGTSIVPKGLTNSFSVDVDFPGHKNPIEVEYVDFEKKMIDTLKIDKSFKTSVLDIVTDGKKSNYLEPNSFVFVGTVPVSFEKKNSAEGINIKKEGSKLFMRTDLPTQYLPMSEMKKVRQSGMPVDDSMYVQVPVGKWVPFKTTTLYLVAGEQFVFRNEIKNAKMVRLPSGKKNVGTDYLTLKVTDGKKEKLVTIAGGKDVIATTEMFNFEGLTYEVQYGSTEIKLPFSVMCKDFVLDKYPGSSMPSSFASEVQLVDTINNYKRDQRIFMNNVMDYNGYRFFQSGYDPDEKGTRLSVNHDWWGTNISYLGYLMMGIGMIMSLFAPIGRFKELNEKLKKTNKRREKLSQIGMLLIGLSILNTGFSQDDHASHDHSTHDHSGHDHAAHVDEVPTKKGGDSEAAPFKVMSVEHSDEIASLLVQEHNGKISPLHTLCDNLLRDIANTTKFEGKNAVQTVMSMHMYPDHWIKVPIISVSKNLREKLGVKSMASFHELTDENGTFKLINEYNTAFQKPEANRNEFDKKLIKLVDNYQVAQGIFSWYFMKIMPVEGEENNKWFTPLDMDLMKKDSTSSFLALKYLNSLDKSSKSNKYGETSDYLNTLKKFQRDIASDVVPKESVIDMEISYNKMHIFKNTLYMYLTFGFLLLILYFVRIFVRINTATNKFFNVVSKVFKVLTLIIFIYHGYGLGMRWMITGHAPWSNGYEAVIFIAWVTMIAGFIFSKRNPVILAGTAILASMMIMVTEMSLMDPQMTPLQPVLKSYWLQIHVSVITSSYGFLGLACILGFLNLILYSARTKKNGELLNCHISELTYVSEMTMTIGLFALAIGTFLGGIWANESWGRYWGWDPKEVWALASVLVYAIILHLRYIPGLKGKFTFNALSMWGYCAILFTFFGVNFYLVGLHSYAQGDGLGEFPTGVIIAALVFAIFTGIAAVRNMQYKSEMKKSSAVELD